MSAEERRPPDVYFCSANPGKREAARLALAGCAERVGWLAHRVTEPLTYDLEALVRAKAMAAYRHARVPVLVEHGGLYVDHLAGLPGPLVQPFWERLGDRLCALVPTDGPRGARFEQALALCDGQRLHIFRGVTRGRLAERASGGNGIHWHPIFVPAGSDRSFGEMDARERHRHLDPTPWEQLCAHLWGEPA